MIKAEALDHRIFIGELDERITIKSISYDQSTTGHEVATQNVLYTRWAKRTYSAPVEMEQSNRETTLQYVHFYIRYVAGISGEMIITDTNNVDYDIVGTEVIGRNLFLKIKTLLAE